MCYLMWEDLFKSDGVGNRNKRGFEKRDEWWERGERKIRSVGDYPQQQAAWVKSGGV